MNARILPVIGATFAILLMSRAVAVSSEGISHKPAIPAKPIAEQNAPSLPTSLAKQCLTGSVLETLNADMARLNIRKKEIMERESALSAIETKLATQMTAIEDVNSALQIKIDNLKSIANDDLKHLVSMYQTMKPNRQQKFLILWILHFPLVF
jgi:flagellar motility protein MotE (MotC chaperone)